MSGLIAHAAAAVMMAWITCTGVIVFNKVGMPCPDIIRTIWAELRPFYLPAAVIAVAYHVAHGHIWGLDLVGHCCNFATWFWFKDLDDDDRWKRRGRKVLDKIRVTEHGLVVAPAEVTR